MEIILRMYAPFMPFITEECNEIIGSSESIHEKKWPSHKENFTSNNFDIAIEIIHKIRVLKSNRKSQGLGVPKLDLKSPYPILEKDLSIIKATARVEEIVISESNELMVEATEDA
ncbi:Valyl/Leucyl/Isoleucyl-tRNA synthetase, class I, anticodon-binding domain protein [mine drainage metagenome]|uniref:Valyl/Leucyl/Isoleucyl-tRNA synthetase, class I, anticodon-binding domain protein n=1 Tax=mine drainage metagenome TaxID=410659 RepID=T1B3P8_9ZZZZ